MSYSHSKSAAAKRRIRLNPRKTPTQSRSGLTVDAILEAAAHILEARGFEGYTTNEIAARAGVSIGSLYQYFPNKDAVTSALITRESATMIAEVRAAGTMTDWHAGLMAMIQAAVRHQLRRPTLARLLDFEENRLSTLPENGRVPKAIYQVVVDLLKRRPASPGEKPETLAFDIIAITRGLADAAGARDDANSSTLERSIERAVFGYLAAT